jgi:TetR/AcrR family transcriptional regulator
MIISTEEKIYEAARKIFIQKGMEGARMQEIADEAGINKALLHYYFRSKENLFNAIFKDIFSRFMLKTRESILSDIPDKEKILGMIDNYVDLIHANPYVPQFIINEINRDPKVLKDLMFETGIEPQEILKLFINYSRKLKIDPRHIIVSILGMVIFPVAAKPLIQMVYFNNDQESYNNFLEERKDIIKLMILKVLEL